MSRRLAIRMYAIVLAVACLASVPALDACTGLLLKTKDQSIIVGRTMEFAYDLHFAIIAVPRGLEYAAAAPQGAAGIKWTTKYQAVGVNMLGAPHIIDGLNEKGLAFQVFMFPGFARYQDVPAGQEAKALPVWQLGTYVLTTCATIDEATAALKSILAWDAPMPGGLPCLPGHCILRDAAGRSVVIEYVDGKLNLYENPLGVITNAPPFDWHLINLRNHVNLSATAVPEVNLAGLELAPIGQGSGMLGLPGDFTPPSRFVRAVAFSQSALPAANAHDGVLQAFHIMNMFDIPLGSTRYREGKEVISELTRWTSVLDLTNRRYYFRTFENSEIRMVDLGKCDGDAKEVRQIPMSGDEKIRDVTGDQKPLPAAATRPADKITGPSK